MREQTFVSLVLYAHNDEDDIAAAMQAVDAFACQTFQNYEIVIVNDCSTDGTQQIVRDTVKNLLGQTFVINLARKHGIELAMMAGLNKAMGDYVYEIETVSFDFSLDILRNMYVESKRGFDIVCASPGTTSLYSKLFYKVINKYSYLELSLYSETVRLVSRRALNAMLNLKEKVRYRKALYAYTGYSKSKIDYVGIPTDGSKRRKLNRENISMALDVIVSFSNVGLKMSHLIASAFFIFSIGMAIYALYNYIFNRDVVEGWTTLMILISMGFAGMFFTTGVVGEYISRMLIELQNRPYYITSSVEIYKEKNQQKGMLYGDFNHEAAAAKANE